MTYGYTHAMSTINVMIKIISVPEHLVSFDLSMGIPTSTMIDIYIYIYTHTHTHACIECFYNFSMGVSAIQSSER